MPRDEEIAACLRQVWCKPGTQKRLGDERHQQLHAIAKRSSLVKPLSGAKNLGAKICLKASFSFFCCFWSATSAIKGPENGDFWSRDRAVGLLEKVDAEQGKVMQKTLGWLILDFSNPLAGTQRMDRVWLRHAETKMLPIGHCPLTSLTSTHKIPTEAWTLAF